MFQNTEVLCGRVGVYVADRRKGSASFALWTEVISHSMGTIRTPAKVKQSLAAKWVHHEIKFTEPAAVKKDEEDKGMSSTYLDNRSSTC